MNSAHAFSGHSSCCGSQPILSTQIDQPAHYSHHQIVFGEPMAIGLPDHGVLLDASKGVFDGHPLACQPTILPLLCGSERMQFAGTLRYLHAPMPVTPADSLITLIYSQAILRWQEAVDAGTMKEFVVVDAASDTPRHLKNHSVRERRELRLAGVPLLLARVMLLLGALLRGTLHRLLGRIDDHLLEFWVVLEQLFQSPDLL